MSHVMGVAWDLGADLKPTSAFRWGCESFLGMRKKPLELHHSPDADQIGFLLSLF